MKVRLLAAAVALVAVGSGCTAESTQSSSATTTTRVAASTTTQAKILSSDDNQWVSSVQPVSAPTTSGTEFFVTAQDASDHLEGVALDAKTGEELWRHRQTLAGRLGGMGIQSPIPQRSGTGWIVVQLEPDGEGAAYVARDARTGTKRWSYPIYGTLEVNACGTLVCFDSGEDDAYYLVALDAATGKEAWSYATPSNPTAMDLTGSTLVTMEIGSPPLLHGLDAKTGVERWTVDAEEVLGDSATTDGGWNSVRIGDDLVVDVGSREGSPSGLVAINETTGEVRWIAKERHLSVHLYADINQNPKALAAIADQPLLAESLKIEEKRATIEDLSRLDPATGKPLWTRPLDFVFDEDAGDIGTIRSSTGTSAWLIDPQSEKLVGVDLSTGAAVAPSGRGWTKVQAAYGDSIKVAGQGKPFGPPASLDEVQLPSRKAVTPTTPPPPMLATSAGTWTAWIDADSHLRALQSS